MGKRWGEGGGGGGAGGGGGGEGEGGGEGVEVSKASHGTVPARTLASAAPQEGSTALFAPQGFDVDLSPWGISLPISRPLRECHPALSRHLQMHWPGPTP